MKIFTLLVTLLIGCATSYSQEFGGTPPNCTLPVGYILSQGDRIVNYHNPLKNCDDECGILTPGVGGNNPGNIVFPAQPVAGITTLTKSFSMFIFDANLRCASDKGFQCSTFVTLYIVPEKYNSVQAPSAADKFGESQPFLLKAHGSANTVSVSFNKAHDQNKKYRVFLDFGKGTTCVQQDTKYIIDILPDGGPMPVNLSAFSVGRTGSAVALAWKTEIQINALNFEVQRSYDNVSFTSIATVTGNINNTSTNSYSYVDNSNTSSSISFYRIKIVKQGEISYSDIKTVKGLANKAGFVVFPNPAVANSRITITDVSEPTRVQLLDNSGRLIKTVMLNNTNAVELNGLQKGGYIMRIIGSVSGHTQIRKLSIVN